MTVVVGIASLFGIAMFVRLKSSLSWTTRLIVLFLGMSIQIVCFRISFLPAIAQREHSNQGLTNISGGDAFRVLLGCQLRLSDVRHGNNENRDGVFAMGSLD